MITTNDRSSDGICSTKWKVGIGNDDISELIYAKESIRKKIFELVDDIYKRDKEIKRINKIKREINPSADKL